MAHIFPRGKSWCVRWRTLDGGQRSQRVDTKKQAEKLATEIRWAKARGLEWGESKARGPESKTVAALRRLVAELRTEQDSGVRVSSAEVPPAINRLGIRLTRGTS